MERLAPPTYDMHGTRLMIHAEHLPLSRPQLDPVHVTKAPADRLLVLHVCMHALARSGSLSKESSGIKVAHSMYGRLLSACNTAHCSISA